MFPIFTRGCNIYKKTISSSDGIPNHAATAIITLLITPTKQMFISQISKVSTVIIPLTSKGKAYTYLETMKWINIDKYALYVTKILSMMAQIKYVPISRST